MYGNGSIMIATENSDTRVPVVCYLAVVVRIENKEMHFKCLENIRSKIVSIFFLSTKNDQLDEFTMDKHCLKMEIFSI